MTGDYVIGTQYTGYSVTYSFFNVSQIGTGFTYFSGFTTASQENFSAGTLDYKGPLDYISTKEDASVEGRLTTNKLTVTNGASASTIGYVLTQTGENGEAEWVINASADTNTYVTGGTLTLPSAGSNLILGWNTGGSANPIDLSSLEFTGNTSGDCITDLYVRRLYGCSPITVHDTITYNGSIIDSATTNSFIFGDSHVLTGSSGTHGTDFDSNVLLGGSNNRLLPSQKGVYNTIIGGSNNTLGISRLQSSSIIGSEDSTIFASNGPNVILGGSNNTINGSNGNVILGGSNNNIDIPISSAILGGTNNSILSLANRSVILGGSGITGTTDDTVYTPDLNVSGDILVENTSGKFFTDIENSSGALVILSSKTDTDIHRISVKTPNSDSISMGVRGSSDVSYPGYGNQGDSFIYSSNPNNGINIISSQGTGTDDYIRFYAGQNANGTTPDLYIQGSGTTRGNVGINTDSPSEKLHINGDVRIDGNPGILEIYDITNLKTQLLQNSYGALTFNINATGDEEAYIVNSAPSGNTIFRCGPNGSNLDDVMVLYGSGNTASNNELIFSGDSEPLVYSRGNLEVFGNIGIKQIGSVGGSTAIGIDSNGKLSDSVSDERLKENILPLNNSLNILLQLSGVSYNWINREDSGNDRFYGFIAQQLEKVDNHLTFTSKSSGYMGVRNDAITPLIVESIKEIYNKPSIPNYTPTSSNDTYGNVGNITTDDDYLYIKTNNGWKRTSLQSF